ncbi:MAG: hypothetical protein ACR2IV_01070, partial [Bryobacteraceae bacterium]
IFWLAQKLAAAVNRIVIARVNFQCSVCGMRNVCDSIGYFEKSGLAVILWCGASSNGDGLNWLGNGSVLQARGWRDLPGSDDKIDVGSALPGLNLVGDTSGKRG